MESHNSIFVWLMRMGQTYLCLVYKTSKVRSVTHETYLFVSFIFFRLFFLVISFLTNNIGLADPASSTNKWVRRPTQPPPFVANPYDRLLCQWTWFHTFYASEVCQMPPRPIWLEVSQRQQGWPLELDNVAVGHRSSARLYARLLFFLASMLGRSHPWNF